MSIKLNAAWLFWHYLVIWLQEGQTLLSLFKNYSFKKELFSLGKRTLELSNPQFYFATPSISITFTKIWSKIKVQQESFTYKFSKNAVCMLNSIRKSNKKAFTPNKNWFPYKSVLYKLWIAYKIVLARLICCLHCSGFNKLQMIKQTNKFSSTSSTF